MSTWCNSNDFLKMISEQFLNDFLKILQQKKTTISQRWLINKLICLSVCKICRRLFTLVSFLFLCVVHIRCPPSWTIWRPTDSPPCYNSSSSTGWKTTHVPWTSACVFSESLSTECRHRWKENRKHHSLVHLRPLSYHHCEGFHVRPPSH